MNQVIENSDCVENRNTGWKNEDEKDSQWFDGIIHYLSSTLSCTKSLIKNGSHTWLGNNKKEDSSKLQSSFHLQKWHIDIAGLTGCNKEVTPLGPCKVIKALPQLSFDPSYLEPTWTNKFKVGRRKLPQKQNLRIF